MPKMIVTMEFDDEDALRAYLGAETRSEPSPTLGPVDPENSPEIAPVEPAPEPVEPAPVEPEPETTEDVDGMPWDAEVHAESRALNDDGTWRAKRGKAEEAKKARAAFKAGGGAVEAPEPAKRMMPGLTAADIPGGDEDEDAPVTYDTLYGKTTSMMERGIIDPPAIIGLYKKVGITDPNVLDTNETLRAALYAELCAIEPEA